MGRMRHSAPPRRGERGEGGSSRHVVRGAGDGPQPMVAVRDQHHMRGHVAGDGRHESGDITHESGDITHESSDVIHESSDVTHESGDVIHESSDVTHESGDVTHESGDATHESSDVIHESGDITHESSDITHVSRRAGQGAAGAGGGFYLTRGRGGRDGVARADFIGPARFWVKPGSPRRARKRKSMRHKDSKSQRGARAPNAAPPAPLFHQKIN